MYISITATKIQAKIRLNIVVNHTDLQQVRDSQLVSVSELEGPKCSYHQNTQTFYITSRGAPSYTPGSPSTYSFLVSLPGVKLNRGRVFEVTLPEFEFGYCQGCCSHGLLNCISGFRFVSDFQQFLLTCGIEKVIVQRIVNTFFVYLSINGFLKVYCQPSWWPY